MCTATNTTFNYAILKINKFSTPRMQALTFYLDSNF